MSDPLADRPAHKGYPARRARRRGHKVGVAIHYDGPGPMGYGFGSGFGGPPASGSSMQAVREAGAAYAERVLRERRR